MSSNKSSTSSVWMPKNRILLYDQYRLVERSDQEISGAWKGIHILLFFIAFLFGLFCTFCFHMLMYMFEDKCILYPKLLSLTPQRYSVVYEFISQDKIHTLPVDFLSTQWVEDRVCYMPMFVPLLSGIFALVWITLFLMCSTGVRTQSGLQQPWRLLFPLLIFSTAMALVCIYVSIFTNRGLSAFCKKLGEFTNSTECSYTVNVASLAYERQIRGVYQATRLTTMAAWVHTSCWIMSAAVVLLRVILVVDFKLIHVTVTFDGELETVMQKSERHIRSISPEVSEVQKHTSTQTRKAPKHKKPVQMSDQITSTTTLVSDSSPVNDMQGTQLKSPSPVVRFESLNEKKESNPITEHEQLKTTPMDEEVAKTRNIEAIKETEKTDTELSTRPDSREMETKENDSQKGIQVKEVSNVNDQNQSTESGPQNSNAQEPSDPKQKTK